MHNPSVPLAEAKNRLSELIDRVSRAEEIVISRHNTGSAYLELAMRRSLPLATLDKQLRAAAKKTGVRCLPKEL